MSIPLTLNFVAICIGIYILKSYISKRASNPSSLPYPPGPKPKPIVGSLLDLPKEESWKTYASWGKEYGDLIHFTVLGKHFIVLNSSRVATDLLERRAHKYSDKPVTPTLSMSDWLWAFSNMPYGEKWRRYRREFHQQFRAEKNRNYRPIMSQRARQLLRNLAGNPEQFVSYLRHYAAAVIMSIAYDYDVASQDDRFVYIAEAAVNMLGHSTFPGATIVNTLPFLRHLPGWLPGMGVKRYTEECRKLTLEMRHAPLELVRKRMASGVPSDCVAANLIDRFSARGGTLEENEETITDVAAMAYAAGADTTVSALTTAFLAMTLYPEAKKKAQAEIDKVVGTVRLPGFEDKDSLPYVEAFVREVFRWRPVAPLCASPSSSCHIPNTHHCYSYPPCRDGGRCIRRVLHTQRNDREYKLMGDAARREHVRRRTREIQTREVPEP